jgi:hypothetical protein
MVLINVKVCLILMNNEFALGAGEKKSCVAFFIKITMWQGLKADRQQTSNSRQ